MSESVSWEPECCLWGKADIRTLGEIKEEPSGDLKAQTP